jgi:DNA-damage-inducible protein J
MATKHAYIRTSIDPDVKEVSEQIFHQLGLTTNEAIRIFLAQVALHGGLPFRVELPSTTDDDLLLPAEMRQAALDVVYED